jgi:hypothetical protein
LKRRLRERVDFSCKDPGMAWISDAFLDFLELRISTLGYYLSNWLL